MFTNKALDELERVFKELRGPNNRPAHDDEDLFICAPGEPLHAPIKVGEVRRLIAMARKYNRLSKHPSHGNY